MAHRSQFEKIAMEHADAVFRAALALTGRREAAEDLTQSVFLKALRRFDSFREGTNCRAWLLRICRNTWIDELRRRKITPTEVPVDEALLADPREPSPSEEPADLLDRFSDEQVIRCLLELSPEARLALLLVDVEGLSQAEAAEVLGVPVGTVKSRTSRGAAILRQRLRVHAQGLGLLGRRK